MSIRKGVSDGKKDLKNVTLLGMLDFSAFLDDIITSKTNAAPVQETAPVALATADGMKGDVTLSPYEKKTYTAKDVLEKQRQLLSQLDPNTTDDEKRVFSELLRALGETDNGRSIMMEVSDQVKFRFDQDLFKKKNAQGMYSPETKTIVLPQAQLKKSVASTLLHEMLHANQDINKGLFIPGIRVLDKVSELDTFLLDEQINYELHSRGVFQDDSDGYSDEWYQSRIKHYQEQGGTPEESKRKANTDFVRAVWGYETEGLDITPGFQDEIDGWHEHYDHQAKENAPVDLEQLMPCIGIMNDGFNLVCKRMNVDLTPYYMIQAYHDYFPRIKVQSWVNSKRDGVYERYYSRTALREKGTYNEGNKVGKWQYFRPDGTIKEECFYNNSNFQLDERKNYYPNGQLKKHAKYSPEGGLKSLVRFKYKKIMINRIVCL